MGVPRDNRDPWVRLKNLEDLVDQMRGALARIGLDAAGNPVFLADADAGFGISKPRLSATITVPGAVTTVTSGTFVEGFTAAGRRQNGVWEVRFTATCDVGTTGAVRAVIGGTSTELIAAAPIGDGATLSTAWSVPLPGGWDDYTIVEIQGQRISGAGNLKIRPYSVIGG